MSQPFQIKVNELAYTKEFKKLEKAWKDLMKESSRDAKTILLDQSRLFVTDLVHFTQPWGKTKKSRDAGEKAAKRDIFRAYKTNNSIYDRIRKDSEEMAKAFYHFAKRGDKIRAQGIIDQLGLNLRLFSFDAGEHHRKRRNNGRVSPSTIPLHTIQEKELRRYSKEVQDRVGFAKSGFSQAIDDINQMITVNSSLSGILTVKKPRRMPKWINRHKGRLGGARFSQKKGVMTVHITNNVRYIKKLVNKGIILKAFNKRANAVKTLTKKVIEINAKNKFKKV